MKKLLTIFCLLSTVVALSQTFNNEWIDYSKTYYKFKVGSTGLYRIPQSALAAINQANTDVSAFQLWRNGVEVPIYTSGQTGVLAPNGFIEFWGEANDGTADQALYRNPFDQINNSKSLFTDTAAYFLTVNAAGANKRLVTVANVIPAGTAPEPFFMHTVGLYPNETIHLGPYSGAVSAPAISASFEGGEGWTSNEITENKTRNLTQANLFPFTGANAPQIQVNMNVVGNSPNNRVVQVKFNNAEIFKANLNGFNYSRLSAALPVSTLNGATENISVTNVATVSNNRIKIATLEITYPRRFNLGGVSNFRFKLPGGGAVGKYLEMAGFNTPGAPILYDLSSSRRYEADASDASLIKVYVQPTVANADMVIANTAANNIKIINSFETRNFVDYSVAANQGDYLMITHKAILNGSDGSQPVEEYRAYRSSDAGGNHNAKVYLIDQLTDQFAYGIKASPLSVRNFLRYARRTFPAPLKSVFLIGRGVKYTAARYNESSSVTERLNLIPSFGEPASDVLLAAEGSSSIPLTPIGRISVINGNELAIYLQKMKQYEEHLKPAESVGASLWKKNMMHIVGVDDQPTIDLLQGYLNRDKATISDTLLGAQVSDFVKGNNAGGELTISDRLRSLMNGGVNMLTYFGHSGTSTLMFNIEEPSNYSNSGKYPLFHMMGCNVGDIFVLDEGRLSEISTISEKYLFAKERGSIGMMAGTSLGFILNLSSYNQQFYKLIATEAYGKPVGQLMKRTIEKVFQSSGGENDIYARSQAEEFVINGDPAIRLYQFEKPDYAIEDAMVTLNPGIISVADNAFTVKTQIANLGKAINQDVVVEVKRTFPDMSVAIVRDTVRGIRYTDSLNFQFAIDPVFDKGANKITVSIDPDNKIAELFETNNTITKEVFIYEDDLKPVFPYNYSVVNSANITFAASTGNPLAASRNYVIEVDTTESFNSSFKISQTKTSTGGVVEFTPAINFKDGAVYYWRVSAASATAGEPVWNSASFTYISGANNGFSQAHQQQFQDVKHEGISVRPSGLFLYDSLRAEIMVSNSLDSIVYINADNYALRIDEVSYQRAFIMPRNVAQQNSLRFYLVDNRTLKPVYNVDLGTTGMYGSYRPIPANTVSMPGFFQFDISTVAARRTVMSFLDSIPDGFYVGLTSNQRGKTVLPAVWQSDTIVLGKDNSLYHKLKAIGLSGIDQINSLVPYVFIYQKGNPVPFAQIVAENNKMLIEARANVPVSGKTGIIRSAIFTRMASYDKLVWDGYSLENPSTDNALISISGVNQNGLETPLMTGIPVSQKMVDLASVNAGTYPGLRVTLQSTDTVNRTPYQVKYWRLYGTPVPEGVIAPNIYYNVKDTLDVGEPMNIGVAFKNVSPYRFDSLSVKLAIRDKNNVERIMQVPKVKPLVQGDTIRLNVSVDTRSLAGGNLAFLEFNPDDRTYQPEQYRFNNFISKDFYVRADSLNPYMDVTFDGMRILNRDIVSSKPDISIKLTDDAKYLLLNSTDLVKVQLRHPDGVLRDYGFNSDTLTFKRPGEGTNDANTALVSFRPHLLQDGEYELIVSGKDQSGNRTGSIDYRISFQVINKPMISNLLNYPNPFTSSTAFVFTLTGSDIPQNIRIQILTVTGKIVREITKAELGPLRIGRNITEFKWDGTDQFGQKLANGVYLYRVLTNLNGKSLDKYSTKDNNTDKYFNKGYGKMVLIR